jgi:hypothetical protein
MIGDERLLTDGFLWAVNSLSSYQSSVVHLLLSQPVPAVTRGEGPVRRCTLGLAVPQQQLHGSRPKLLLDRSNLWHLPDGRKGLSATALSSSSRPKEDPWMTSAVGDRSLYWTGGTCRQIQA